jgi:hypothetical protein
MRFRPSPNGLPVELPIMGVMPAGPDARHLLASLVGMSIPTVTGRPNAVIGIDDAKVRVGTSRSPDGEMVPIEWVQNGIDLLSTVGEVEVNSSTLGRRSSFVGAAAYHSSFIHRK